MTKQIPQKQLLNFSVVTQINPLGYWRGDNTVQSGGLVDSVTNLGTGGAALNFTAAGAARCPTGTDAFGNVYLAPDGVADFMQAGAAIDWAHLINGTPWTMGCVLEITGAPAAGGYLLQTSNGAGAANQYRLFWTRVSATQYGPTSTIFQGGIGPVTQSEYLSPTTNRFALVIQHHGNMQIAQPNVLGLSQVMRLAGFQASYQGAITNAYPAGAPPAPLTLFASSAPGNYGQNMRLYELWITGPASNNVPEGVLLDYEQYARTYYHAAA